MVLLVLVVLRGSSGSPWFLWFSVVLLVLRGSSGSRGSPWFSVVLLVLVVLRGSSGSQWLSWFSGYCGSSGSGGWLSCCTSCQISSD